MTVKELKQRIMELLNEQYESDFGQGVDPNIVIQALGCSSAQPSLWDWPVMVHRDPAINRWAIVTRP